MKVKAGNAWKRWLLLFVCGLGYVFVLLLLTAVERGAPEGKILTIGDAFWYSVVTLSTVGYGDLYPVTTGGRLLGLLLVLMSVGLLSFVVSAMINLLTGQLLPAIQLWLLRGRQWYVFSELNDASAVLARNLQAQENGCVFLFPQSERSKAPGDLKCVFFGGDLNRVLSGKKEKCSLFFVDAESGTNYSKALNALDLECPVYCRTEQAPERCPDNLKLFNRYDCCARDYWKKMGLSGKEQTVLIIGNGKYAQRLLERALLINVFGSDRAVRYHVFGNWGDFRRNHHRLGAVLCINEDKPGMDSLYFHENPWNAEEALLYNADRIILCSDSEQENLSALMQLRRYFPTKGDIHIRAAAPIPGEKVFGTNEQIYSAEHILRDRLDYLARAMHQIYCDSSGAEMPGWNALSEFMRQSNIAAADHLLVKMRLLLGDDSLSEVTMQVCEAAYQCYCRLDEAGKSECRRIEHMRWMRFHSLHNWRYGPVRDNQARVHPMLVPYDALAPQEQKKDDYAWSLLDTMARYTQER